ncbi:MAG: ATP-dependent RecD-like DNA helicase [Anaerolineae bacterium]|nr:ATP-dependent RecD-like DNA helicase [Anaerolineae bacterium]
MSKDQISGSVERITYYNEENGYTVLRLNPDAKGMLPFKYASGRDALITVVGTLPELNPGEWLKLTGQWATHAKHGRQFQAELCEQSQPATVEGIKRYLGSGLVRGVGKVMAERIVDRFGLETLDVIDNEPERLQTVLGIGRKRAALIEKAWDEQRAIKDVMLFLQSHNVSTNLAVKIYKQYGDEALAVVQNTPYKLVQDVRGIGFKTADKIARDIGLAHDDPARIEAGIAYTLNRMAQDGHVYVPQELLEPEASEILGVQEEQITYVIDRLEDDNLIKRETLQYEAVSQQPSAISYQQEHSEIRNPTSEIKEERAVYLTPFYYSEVGVTNRIRRLVDQPTSRIKSGFGSDRVLTQLLAEVERKSGMALAPQQRQGIIAAVSNKVAILTGGPGTGKTTTLRTLLDLLDRTGRQVALASPTGRAAKRLAEATDRPAKTIHRLLEFQPGVGFGRNEENPIQADMIIIDEASMLDLVLANNLLKAVPLNSHLLLVGDIDQLPSVGAGDVLGDLIDSGVPAVVRLETIFRQSADSLIIQNAHRINHGQTPITDPNARDFFLFVKNDLDTLPDLLVEVVQQRVPHKFGLDPFDDIQVLAPMYHGQAGVLNLNTRLQLALNPPGRRKMERRLGGRVFRVGDKVMQTVNNYDKHVYNGDIGRITAIDPVMQTMTLNVDGAPIAYDFLEADELVHAYAISVHKAQGAEYPCIVMPVVTQHYMMLQRNLLYTAITRARKLVILIGTRKAIAIAVRNNKTTERHTALDWRLTHKT